jgi:hypothetical protein
MREALARGELGNPDAEIAERYRVLPPEVVEAYRAKRKAKSTPQ